MAEEQQLRRRFGLQELAGQAGPRYNIAPTQAVLVVQGPIGQPTARMVRWGLIPFFARDPRASRSRALINARVETVGDKPSFRRALRFGRVLVPASHFYEWKRTKGGRTPMLIRRKDGELLCFAGICDRWTDPNTGEHLDTMAILTTSSNELVATVHDRMPVILDSRREAEWLAGQLTSELLDDLSCPYPADGMDIHPVTPSLVSDSVSDQPELILPT